MSELSHNIPVTAALSPKSGALHPVHGGGGGTGREVKHSPYEVCNHSTVLTIPQIPHREKGGGQGEKRGVCSLSSHRARAKAGRSPPLPGSLWVPGSQGAERPLLAEARTPPKERERERKPSKLVYFSTVSYSQICSFGPFWTSR